MNWKVISAPFLQEDWFDLKAVAVPKQGYVSLMQWWQQNTAHLKHRSQEANERLKLKKRMMLYLQR